MPNLYEYVNEIDGSLFFYYIIIFLIFYIFFKNYEIKLNVIVGMIFAFLCIIYINEKNKKTKNDDVNLRQKKAKIIEPEVKKLKKYNDIIDFLFSIQDLYIYNPQAFEEMHHNITNFFIVYEDILKNKKQTNNLYNIADKNMNDSINNLHSIIYNLPENDINVRNKLHVAMDVLEKILNKYLNEIYEYHIDNLNNGYNVDYKIINTGPKEHNYYGDDITNFNFII